MNALIFKRKFKGLSSSNKAIFLEYCRLYSDASLSPDFLLERISSIWKQAEQEPELLACLQLADYIYGDTLEETGLDENKRIYLSEHLVNELGLDANEVNSLLPLSKRDICKALRKVSCLLLQCPDGGYVIVQGHCLGNKLDENSLDGWVCSQCQGDLANHVIISDYEGASPED